jgi:hypothetical protein
LYYLFLYGMIIATCYTWIYNSYFLEDTMKSKLILIVSILSMMFLVSCDDDDGNQSCGYCDDSGCYGCEGDFCWPIDNEPCNGETCSEGFFCAEFGCAKICTHPADCALGEVCLPEGYCSVEENPEVKCSTDEDCGNGTICEFDDVKGYYTCIPGCQSNDDCEEDEVCASCSRCVPKENPVCGDSKVFCETSEECGLKVCSVDQKCAITCDMLEPLCPVGQICSENVCIDDQSPEVPECVFSVNCDGSALCINGYCHDTCEIDDECGTAEFCDLGVCKADYRPQF